MIQVVTTKDFRKSFEKYADDVANYNETIIVARPKKKNIVGKKNITLGKRLIIYYKVKQIVMLWLILLIN